MTNKTKKPKTHPITIRVETSLLKWLESKAIEAKLKRSPAIAQILQALKDIDEGLEKNLKAT